ncbi:restriction endonuclease [Thermosphaera chiliense]|uniref:Restriction endonuclease n=1 Tax=Thermosphaera chiliense TaxID=3402707 RepID=A0A7M1US84_9CREN|nr:restriction endonuclease [Thermosphaera aggregans]QOR93882.1 restriction endonuclease [Thermosphaera aggregans]
MPSEDLIVSLLKHRRLFLDELARLSGLSRHVLLEKLRELDDLIEIHGEEVVVREVFKLLEHGLEKGLEIGKLSSLVDWKEFEKLSSEVFSLHGYETINNVSIFSPQRLQVDVVAINASTGLSFVVDCKHWSASSKSRLAQAASSHYERTVRLSKMVPQAIPKYPLLKKTRFLIPLLVTLLTPSLRSHRNVLIVSIRELNNVLREAYYVLEEFNIKPIPVVK